MLKEKVANRLLLGPYIMQQCQFLFLASFRHLTQWPQIFKRYGEELPNLLGLIDLLLSLPASSAEAERVFSRLKVLKSDIRSNLRDCTVSDLITIQLLAPEIADFNPQEAIHLWNKSSRRPNTTPYGPRPQKETECDDDEGCSDDECLIESLLSD